MNEIRLSHSILQEAIVIARELGDKHLLGMGLEMYVSVSAMIKAEDTPAAAMEGLEIFRELNFSPGVWMAYSNLGHWEAVNGNFQESEKYMALAQAGMKAGTISIQFGFFNLGLGMSACFQGHFERAQQYFEEGHRIFNPFLPKLLARNLRDFVSSHKPP